MAGILNSAARQLAWNIAVLLVGRTASALCALVAWTIMARALSPGPFGLLQIGLAIFVYVELVGDFGLSTYGSRRVARGYFDDVGTVMGSRLLLAVCAVTIVWTAALSARSGLALLIPLGAAQLAVAINPVWGLRGQERPRAVSAVDLGGSIAFLLVTLILVHTPHDAELAALALLAREVIASAIGWRLFGGGHRIRISARTLQLIRASAPLGISAVAVAVYYGLDTILLGLLRGPAEAGVYSAVYRLVLPWLAAAGVAGGFILPALIRQRENGRSLDPLLSGLSKTLLLVGLLVALEVSFLAAPVVHWLFGGAYKSGDAALQVLVWSVVTVYANVPFAYLLLAEGRDRTYMLITLVGAIVNVAANVLLIPPYGLVGAAWATIAAEVCVLGSVVAMTRGVSVKHLASSVKQLLLPTVVVAVLLVVTGNWGMWAIPLSVAVYAGGALSTGAIPLPRGLLRTGRGLGPSQ